MVEEKKMRPQEAWSWNMEGQLQVNEFALKLMIKTVNKQP
jgi:hypothetical protein